MGETNATVGKAARSGGTTGGAVGVNAKGKLVLGEIEELGDKVFKFGTKDQAACYIETKEAIAHWVGMQYSKDMRMLVKNGTEKTFTEPTLPTLKKGEQYAPGVLERYKQEWATHDKDKKKYQDDKDKTFLAIWGQGTQAVKMKLESDPDLEELEENSDVKGLLKKLMEMAFSSGGVQHLYWTAQQAVRRLVSVNQGPNETVANYKKRILTHVQDVEAQFGLWYPNKLATSTTDKDIEAARQQFLAMQMIAGADPRRYGGLKDDLNNQYLSKKKDAYPPDLDSATDLLTHYQDSQTGSRKMIDSDGNLLAVASFAQVKSKRHDKLRCFLCNELGHVKRNCPRLQQQNNNQMEEEADEEEEQGSRASGSGGRRRAWYQS